MKRKNFSLRTKTHLGQLLPDICFFNTSKFLNNIWKERKYWAINSYFLGNMDETPVFFNMVENRTVTFKGAKSVVIKTQNEEKCRCSLLLTITADGTKLPLNIIFMAKEGGKVEKELNKNDILLKGRCFISCNSNAWFTSKIMKL